MIHHSRVDVVYYRCDIQCDLRWIDAGCFLDEMSDLKDGNFYSVIDKVGAHDPSDEIDD